MSITARICALVFAVMGAPAFAEDRGLEAWSKVYEVFSHPRCVNCHVGPDNVPMWSEPARGLKARPHGMNINAGESRRGAEHVACGSCHTQQNAQAPNGPPGAPVWHLPPASMQWFGKSSVEVCEQIKDPARNGGRTIAKVAEHIEHDRLAQWGWAPGLGREAAPYSIAEMVQLLKRWDAAGAPCPK